MEIVVAVFLLCIGLVVAWDSARLGARWGDDGPQSGYFPFYVGLIIACSAAVILWQALRGLTPDGRGTFVERGQLRLVLSVLLPALVYVIVIQCFGIYLASAIFHGGNQSRLAWGPALPYSCCLRSGSRLPCLREVFSIRWQPSAIDLAGRFDWKKLMP